MSKVKTYESVVTNEIKLEVDNFNPRDPAYTELNKLFNLLYCVNLDLNLSYEFSLSIKNRTKDKGAVLSCNFRYSGRKSDNHDDLSLLNKKKKFTNILDEAYLKPAEPNLEIVNPFIED